MSEFRINPAVIAALEHYAQVTYNFREPTVFIHTDKDGYQTEWPLERACGVAAELLADERLNYLKIRLLQAGLKQYGLNELYKRITGQDL